MKCLVLSTLYCKPSRTGMTELHADRCGSPGRVGRCHPDSICSARCGWTFLAAEGNSTRGQRSILQLKRLSSGSTHVGFCLASLYLCVCIAERMQQRNIRSHDDRRYNCQEVFGGVEVSAVALQTRNRYASTAIRRELNIVPTYKPPRKRCGAKSVEWCCA